MLDINSMLSQFGIIIQVRHCFRSYKIKEVTVSKKKKMHTLLCKLPGLILATYCLRYLHAMPSMRNRISLLTRQKAHAF